MSPTHQQASVLDPRQDRVEVTPYDRPRHGRLLALIGSIPPEAWDAIIPHGPRLSMSGVAGRIDRVALNPQPLPPRQALPSAAADLARDLVQAAVTDEMQGRSSAGAVRELIDDWCATPWPKKWPWPGPRRDADLRPDEWATQTARVVGAVIFASMASRLADGDLRDALADGAQRLAEVAVAGTAAH